MGCWGGEQLGRLMEKDTTLKVLTEQTKPILDWFW